MSYPWYIWVFTGIGIATTAGFLFVLGMIVLGRLHIEKVQNNGCDSDDSNSVA
jgi:hypothetical protein